MTNRIATLINSRTRASRDAAMKNEEFGNAGPYRDRRIKIDAPRPIPFIELRDIPAPRPTR